VASWHEELVPVGETAGISPVAMQSRDDATTPAGVGSPPMTMLGAASAVSVRSDAAKRRSMHAAMAAAVRALRSRDGRAIGRPPSGGVL
jgi:hypothetical protein